MDALLLAERPVYIDTMLYDARKNTVLFFIRLICLTSTQYISSYSIHTNGVIIDFILSQAVNSVHIKCEKNWYFSTVKKYRIFSLVTDTIYIFTVEKNRTVAKQGFLGNFVTENF